MAKPIALVCHDGTRIPRDIRADTHTGLAVHSAADGSAVPYQQGRTYVEIKRLLSKGVFFRERRSRRPSCTNRRSCVVALNDMARRALASDQADARRRVDARRVARNEDVLSHPRTFVATTKRNSHAITDAVHRLPVVFQKWMCASWSRYVNVMEIYPEWFVYTQRVRHFNILRIERELKRRYSDTDWKSMMARIIADPVFTCETRCEFQNLPASVFVRMRLLRCVEEQRPRELRKALEAVDLCKEYKNVFLDRNES
jgi:hypothetical protein